MDKVKADFPVRVPLATVPLGIWGSLQAGRRNVLELIPEIATRKPILSGTTGKRWHMLAQLVLLKALSRMCTLEFLGLPQLNQIFGGYVVGFYFRGHI